MNKTKHKFKLQNHWLLALIPFLLAVAIMAPRLISPQFGLLDDPVTLSRSKALAEGNFDLSSDFSYGRFRPLYWLVPGLIYRLVGASAFWHFFALGIVLLTLLFEIRVLLKYQGVSEIKIVITSLVFLSSVTLIENFYTLSKGEPLQLVFILLGWILFEKLKRSQSPSGKIIPAVLILLSFLAATLVKETSLVMIVISGLWFLVAWVKHQKNNRKSMRDVLILLGIAVLSIVMFFLMRKVWGAAAINDGTYTQHYGLAINEIMANIGRWAVLIGSNFLYLLPFSITIVLLWVWHKDFRQNDRFYSWLIWCLGWFSVLLPWDFAESYYLLPFSLGVAALVGEAVPEIVKAISGLCRSRKVTLSIFLGLTCLLWFITLPNTLTSARVQLLVDRINQAVMEETAQTLTNNGLALVNIQVENEYVYNMELSLRNQYERRDIRFNNVDSRWLDTPPLEAEPNTLFLLPTISHQPNLTVRMGIQETAQTIWNPKLLSLTEPRPQLIKQFSGSIRLTNINLATLACPLVQSAGFCQNPDPVFDFRLFSYGWEIYQIQ
ncbi:hypothetical protein KQH50_00190 [bacterium]|nr:hypothetical protein [bacterium]